MGQVNLHTHCAFCDGRADMEAFILAAIERQMEAIGISCHGPVPWPTDWTMPPENLPAYIRAVQAMRKKYGARIRIHAGIEADFIPGKMGPARLRQDFPELEYSIGSCHFLGAEPDGTPWTVDDKQRVFDRQVQAAYGGDARPLVEAYYQRLTEMLQQDPPDIVAHFDLIKKNNADNRHFDETAPWYQKAALEALDAIARAGAILEINTGGIARGRSSDYFPARYLLQAAREKNIPICIHSDAHKPDQVNALFDAAAEFARSVGYTTLRTLGPGGWEDRPF